MSSKFLALGVLAVATIAAPAEARLVKLSVGGIVTAGTDGGNELTDVTNGPGGYMEHFAPSSVFGTIGSLTGKALVFSLVYDTDSPFLPVGSGGVFDDAVGEWAYSISPKLSIGGVKIDLMHIEPVFNGLALGATLGLGNGTPDSLSGTFTGFTFSGNVLSDYRTGNLSFAGLLPASFFSTDALLPGQLPGPGYGFNGHGASGTGSFDLTRQICFLTCSYKQATGTFALTAISFGAVPEPAAWTLMLAGFALVGTAARRRRPASVAA